MKKRVSKDTPTNAYTKVFGIIPCLKSYTVIIIIIETIMRFNTISGMEMCIKKISKKSPPVKNSTMGYCIEILPLHTLQAPFQHILNNAGKDYKEVGNYIIAKCESVQDAFLCLVP